MAKVDWWGHQPRTKNIVGAAALKHQQWRNIDISLNCGERGTDHHAGRASSQAGG